MPRHKLTHLDRLSHHITDWMGTTQALVVHTFLFLFSFTLILLGFNANTVMLIVTTAVSLEAIYLALFIQMTVNRQTRKITSVERDIDAIQEDVESLEDIHDDTTQQVSTHQTLKQIESEVRLLATHLSELQSQLSTLKSTPPLP